MDIGEIKGLLHSALHSRRIGYNVAVFEKNVSINVNLPSKNNTFISLAYLIEIDGKKVYLYTKNKTLKTENLNMAIGLMVKDLRKKEVKYNKEN